MIKLRFKTTPVGNLIRYTAMIGIIAVFVFRTDLTKLLFKKTVEELKGPEITHAMSADQVAEILEIVKKPIAEKAQEMQQPINNEKETAITLSGNQMFVPVTIGYRGRMVTVPLLIDTGATGVTISPALAIRLGIKPEDTKQGLSQLADGSKVGTNTATVDFVAVGPKTKKPTEIHIIGAGFEETGLLGMSFLGDFPHMINLKTQTIKWM